MQKLVLFALKHPLNRDAGPARNNLCNILWVNLLINKWVLIGSLLCLQSLYLLLHFNHLAITDLRNLTVIAVTLSLICLKLECLNLLSLALDGIKQLLLLPPLFVIHLLLSLQALKLGGNIL